MKKLVIGAFLAMILMGVVLVVVGLALPTEYAVERSVVIQGDPGEIYAMISDLKTWPDWSSWNKAAYPEMVSTFEGPAGRGSRWSWEDPKGNGSMEITRSDPASGITYDLLFEGFSKSIGTIALQPGGEGVKVTMRLEGDVKGSAMGPLGSYMVLFMDQAMGPEFEKGLDGLKSACES